MTCAARTMPDDMRADLRRLFIDDLRPKIESTDDPAALLWLALHASAAIAGDLGRFEDPESGIKVW